MHSVIKKSLWSRRKKSDSPKIFLGCQCTPFQSDNGNDNFTCMLILLVKDAPRVMKIKSMISYIYI